MYLFSCSFCYDDLKIMCSNAYCVFNVLVLYDLWYFGDWLLSVQVTGQDRTGQDFCIFMHLLR